MKRRKFLFNNYFLIFAHFIYLVLTLTVASNEFCPENICQNGGTCLTDGLNGGKFYCECPQPYTGTICEFTASQKPCTLKCQNDGVCQQDNRLMREVCDCPSGFQGKLCEEVEDCTIIPCNSKKVCLYNVNSESFNCEDDLCQLNEPCQFNTTCRPAKSDYFCECPNGLAGKNCSEDVDECASNTKICENNGNCQNNFGDFECHCPIGFEGKYCEKTLGFCHQNPCQNRGICRELPSAYSCHCFAKYTGSHCETDLSKECSLPQQLVYMPNGRIQCVCPKGYTGSNCDVRIETKKNDRNNFLQYVENSTIKPKTFLKFLSTTILPTTFLSLLNLQQTTPQDFPTPLLTFSTELGKNEKSTERHHNFTAIHFNSIEPKCKTLECNEYKICRLQHNLDDTNAYCNCPHGMIGELCQQSNAVTFKNFSIFLSENFKPKKLALNFSDYSIEFSFRTTLSSVFFAIGEDIAGQSEYEIYLRNGKLIVKLLNSLKVELKLLKALNDANWYTIRFVDWRRTGLFVQVLDDSNDKVLAERKMDFIRPIQVFITRMGRKGDDYFVGCMRDVQINNQTIDFFQQETRSVGIEFGCNRQNQCSNNNFTCANDAECIDLWSERQCRCKRPYFGSNCLNKLYEVTFGNSNKSSFIKYLLNPKTDELSIRLITEISFFVRTNEPNGNIFYLGEGGSEDDGTFISAELVSGYLQTNLRIGGKQIASGKSKRAINNNLEHFVEISRFQNNVLLTIDKVGSEKTIIKINRPFEHPLLAQTLLIGDLIPGQIRFDAFHNLSAHFKGTIQDFRVNNQFVLLHGFDKTNISDLVKGFDKPVFGQKIVEQNILKGTVSDDICAERNLCVNGKCTNTFNDFICKCNKGWFGELCSEQDYCGSSSNPCPAKSICLNLNGGYVCLAPVTFAPTSFANFDITLQPNYLSPLKQTNLTFDIRTRSLNANLLKLTSSTESLQLFLSNGTFILFDYQNKTFAKNETILLNSESGLSNGNWHTIILLDNSKHLEIVFDNLSLLSKTPFSLKRFALDPKSGIRFGKSDREGSIGFKGCIKNVKFGSMAPLSFFEGANGFGGFELSRQNVFFKLTNQQNLRPQNCFSDNVCFVGNLNPCQNGAQCKNVFNKRSCKCPAGFGGEFCHINLDDCDLTNNNHKNVSQKCGANGVCVDEINNFSCMCDAGFTGHRCETPIAFDNPCDLFKNACMNGGKCKSTASGDVQCICLPNFVGQYCQTLKDSKCEDLPCENNSKCIKNAKSFNCICPNDFGGELCDVELNSRNPCQQKLCQNGGECLSSPEFKHKSNLQPYNVFPKYSAQNFTCKCLAAFEGKRCERFVDACSSGAKCQNGAHCENIFGGHICHCTEGWRGADCSVDVDECAELAPCENGAQCQNTPGSFQCDCPAFYFGDYCNKAGACAAFPCKNGAECIQETAYEHTCQCLPGYRGKFCEEEIDFCVDEPCQNGATCHRVIAGFECFCLAGYNGTICEVDIDECDISNKEICANNGTCVDRINAFECNCRGTGFAGPQCLDDIDECAIEVEKFSSYNLPSLNLKKHSEKINGVLRETLMQTNLTSQNQKILLNCVHGLCTNFPGSYRCDCEEGFIGQRCNMANPCIVDARTNHTLHSCVHGHCVRPSVVRQASGREVTQHECDCHAGYTGPQCTFLIQASKTLPVGFVLGPIGVLFVILTIFGTMLFLFVARKKRATQGSYSPSTQEMTGTTRVSVPPLRNLSLASYKYSDGKNLKDSVNASLNNNVF